MNANQFKTGQRVWTTVTTCGVTQRMAQGVVTAIHSGYCDVDVMSLHGGAPWVQQHANYDLEATKLPEGTRCSCGALATGWMSDGTPRCCATCAFHPQGCRCQFGDAPNTVNDVHV